MGQALSRFFSSCSEYQSNQIVWPKNVLNNHKIRHTCIVILTGFIRPQNMVCLYSYTDRPHYAMEYGMPEPGLFSGHKKWHACIAILTGLIMPRNMAYLRQVLLGHIKWHTCIVILTGLIRPWKNGLPVLKYCQAMKSHR